MGQDVNRKPQAELYTPLTHTMELLPAPHFFDNTSSMILMDSGQVFILGESQAQIYEASSKRFEWVGALNIPRYYAQLNRLIDGRIVIHGGTSTTMSKAPNCNALRSTLAQLASTQAGKRFETKTTHLHTEIYNSESGHFEKNVTTVRPSTPQQKLEQELARCNNERKLEADRTLNAELYDPKTGKITLIGQAFVNHYNQVPKGFTLNHPQVQLPLSVLEAYKPASTLPFYLPELQQTRTFESKSFQHGTHHLLWLNTGAVIQVKNAQTPPSLQIELISPASQKMQTTTLPLRTNTGFFWGGTNAVLLNNGKILLTGGFHRKKCPAYFCLDYEPLNIAFLFDPKTQRYESLPPLLKARGYHQSIVLDDGQVLMIGGLSDYSGGRVERTLELYTPDP